MSAPWGVTRRMVIEASRVRARARKNDGGWKAWTAAVLTNRIPSKTFIVVIVICTCDRGGFTWISKSRERISGSAIQTQVDATASCLCHHHLPAQRHTHNKRAAASPPRSPVRLLVAGCKKQEKLMRRKEEAACLISYFIPFCVK